MPHDVLQEVVDKLAVLIGVNRPSRRHKLPKLLAEEPSSFWGQHGGAVVSWLAEWSRLAPVSDHAAECTADWEMVVPDGADINIMKDFAEHLVGAGFAAQHNKVNSVFRSNRVAVGPGFTRVISGKCRREPTAELLQYLRSFAPCLVSLPILELASGARKPRLRPTIEVKASNNQVRLAQRPEDFVESLEKRSSLTSVPRVRAMAAKQHDPQPTDIDLDHQEARGLIDDPNVRLGDTDRFALGGEDPKGLIYPD